MNTTIILLGIATIFAVVGVSFLFIVRRQSDRVEEMWQEPRFTGNLRDAQWAEVPFPMDSPVPVPILERIKSGAGSVHPKRPAILASARKLFFDIHQASLDQDYRKLLSCATNAMFGRLISKLIAYGGPGVPRNIDSLTEELLDVEELAGEYTAHVRFSGILSDRTLVPGRPVREVWTIRKESDPGTQWMLAEVFPDPPLSLVKSIDPSKREQSSEH